MRSCHSHSRPGLLPDSRPDLLLDKRASVRWASCSRGLLMPVDGCAGTYAGEWRMRATTITRRWTEGANLQELAMGFDQVLPLSLAPFFPFLCNALPLMLSRISSGVIPDEPSGSREARNSSGVSGSKPSGA